MSWAAVALAANPTARAGEPFVFTDAFDARGRSADGEPDWRTVGVTWELKGGSLVREGGAKDFAEPANSPLGREVRLEADVRLRRAVGRDRDWKIAGLAVRRDARNFWHLALVEAPESGGRRHFVELTEMLEGTWLANHAEGTRLRQTASHGTSLDWSYGRTYRLAIALDPKGITGTVADVDGTVRTRIAYAFDDAKAVTFGRPALTSSGFRVEFDDFETRVASPVPERDIATERPDYSGSGFEGVRGRKTGFFHVEEHGGRWWMIDPRGHGFFNVGTDHVDFKVHWCEKLGYAPYHRNAKKRHGSEEKWAASTVARLKAWGFNALGTNSGRSVRYKGLPHTEFLGLGVGFTSVDAITERTTWTGFPNVFSPKWPRWCDKRARAMCVPNRDDPWLIGYFIDNELEWHAWTAGSPFEESFKKPRGHSAKTALVDLLTSRHPTAESFNRAWGTRVADLDELHDMTTPPKPATDAARADERAFIRLCAERYFSVAEAAIRKHDPNHMILGCRYAGGGPDIMDIAGRHVDIFSINCYRRVDLETGVMTDGFEDELRKWHAQVKRPFIITEWSFPALDAGLPCKHGAGQRVPTQKDKAFAFTAFQKLLFSTPFMVGSNYFMWADEPELGISSTFPEDSNYGLVDVNDDPYKLLTEAAAALHGHVYAIHSGAVTGFSVEAGEGRGPFVVRNSGGAAGECVAVIRSGRTEVRRRLALAPGAETRVTLPRQVLGEPGGHLVTCRLEPDEPLLDKSMADDVATRAIYIPGTPWRAPTESRLRVPVLVANPTAEELWGVQVSLGHGDLPPSGTVDWSRLIAVDGRANAGKWALMHSGVREFEDGAEFVVSLNRPLGPGEARTVFLYESRSILPGVGSVRRPAIRERGEGFEINSGAFLLTKENREGGNAFDRIVMRGEQGDPELGCFRPLLWLVEGGNAWVPPDRVEKVEPFPAAASLALDMTFARGTGGGRSFRVKYRFEFPPARDWFSSRLMWIENTGTEPMRIEGYYHYAPSKIGGDSAGDEPRGDRWVDEGVGACYGVVPASSGIGVHFWKDEGGGQHPDAFRKLGITLAPGERYAKREPVAYVVGCRATEWDAVAREVKALGRVIVRAFELERP
jgi:agarase